MSTVTAIDSGTVSSEITASSGLIVSIMISTPMTVSTDVISWVRVCWSELADVVDVVGDAAQDVAARVAVEVAQRQAASFSSTSPAQPVDGPLGDAGHDVRLAPGEDRAEEVETAATNSRVCGERVKSMPWPGDDGSCSRACRPAGLAGRSQRVDRLLLRQPGRDLLADDAVEDDVGRVAQDLRARRPRTAR